MLQECLTTVILLICLKSSRHKWQLYLILCCFAIGCNCFGQDDLVIIDQGATYTKVWQNQL